MNANVFGQLEEIRQASELLLADLEARAKSEAMLLGIDLELLLDHTALQMLRRMAAREQTPHETQRQTRRSEEAARLFLYQHQPERWTAPPHEEEPAMTIRETPAPNRQEYEKALANVATTFGHLSHAVAEAMHVDPEEFNRQLLLRIIADANAKNAKAVGS